MDLVVSQANPATVDIREIVDLVVKKVIQVFLASQEKVGIQDSLASQV